MTATKSVLMDRARSWIEDCSVELVGMIVDPERLTNKQVRASVEKHYNGGWEGFVAVDGLYDEHDWHKPQEPFDRPPHVERTTDHRGCTTTRCLDCGDMLILFDDDEHFCEVTQTSTEFWINDYDEDD